MSRPLFNHSSEQLEALFDEGRASIETLTLLKNELVHRSSNRAKKLLEAVKATLERKSSSVPPSECVLPLPTNVENHPGSDVVDINTSGSQASDDGKYEVAARLPSHGDPEDSSERR